MDKQYIVDLSQRLIPGKEHNFNFDIDLRDAAESMELAYDDSVWYKIAYVSMCTHNSTHVEVPFHHIKEGLQVADFPLERLIGNLTLLDFSYKPDDGVITLEDLKQYDDQIHEGDILFIKTHMDKYFRSADWNTYPYIEVAGIEWLISKKIAVLGTDAAGIECQTAYNQPGHVTLFKANIPLVESLTNLDAVESGKYLVCILPLPIEKGDACPSALPRSPRKASERCWPNKSNRAVLQARDFTHKKATVPAGTAAFCITSCCARIRHFRPINVIDFHNIHLCHLFGGRHLCMLCCSNIVLTFLTRILTKLPKSAHFWLSFEPLEKSSFFKGECQNTLIQLWFWADKTA